MPEARGGWSTSKVTPKVVSRAGKSSSGATPTNKHGTKRSSEEISSNSPEEASKKLKPVTDSTEDDEHVSDSSKTGGTSWGLSKYSTVEEEADRETAAAVLHGLNRNTRAQFIQIQSPASSRSGGDRRQSGRMAQRRANIDQEQEDGAPSPAAGLGGTADTRSRAKVQGDDSAAKQRLKLTRKHQAAEWVRNLTAQWTDVALGRECLLGLRSFEPMSVKPEKRSHSKQSGPKQIDDERNIRRAAGAMKIVQAGLVLPYSFGPDRGLTYHTVYLKKSARGVGLKVRVIDNRVVVRGFASWFDSSRNNVRINDVIAAANAIDACTGRADRIMAEFNFKPPAGASEKVSVGMSLVEETICVRLARPNIYVDVAEEPRAIASVQMPRAVASVSIQISPVQASISAKVVEPPKPASGTYAVPVRVRITSSEPSILTDILPTPDQRAPRIMPKVRVVPGVAKHK